jgi:pimeloyl-ACP methyl ester carboxylesterase
MSCTVVCQVAELAGDRISRLVFVDALALLPAERVADIVNRPAANEVTEMTTAPTRQDAEGRMFADLEPAMRAWVLARYRPIREGGGDPLPAGVQPSRVASAPDGGAPEAPYTEMDTGHYPMLSHPAELARLLNSA